MNLSSAIIPILLVALFVFGLFKKMPLYDIFTDGAKKAFSLVLSIFPNLCAIFLMINLLELSGIKTRLIDLLTPFLSFLGVPSEVVPLIVIKPFSGSGSLALLDEIFTSNGADSYVGRVASVIFGSSETTFYIAAVYFSDCKTKKLFAPIVISLVATLISAAVACLLCRIM